MAYRLGMLGVPLESERGDRELVSHQSENVFGGAPTTRPTLKHKQVTPCGQVAE